MAATKGMKTGRAAGGGTKEKLSCRLVTAPKMKGRKEGRKEGRKGDSKPLKGQSSEVKE